jgi:hypothetical protein
MDVVGVHVKRLGPTEFADGGFGRRPHALGLRTNYDVLAIRLVPDRNDGQTVFGGTRTRAQLGLRLMSKTVADSEGVLCQH